MIDGSDVLLRGTQVKALCGGKGSGGLRGAQIAVCTIEKANTLVSRMAAADVSQTKPALDE